MKTRAAKAVAERPVVRGQIGFRLTPDLRAYLEGLASREETDVSTVLRDTVAFRRDVERLLGDEWWELLRRANVMRRPVGVEAGELLGQALRTAVEADIEHELDADRD